MLSRTDRNPTMTQRATSERPQERLRGFEKAWDYFSLGSASRVTWHTAVGVGGAAEVTGLRAIDSLACGFPLRASQLRSAANEATPVSADASRTLSRPGI